MNATVPRLRGRRAGELGAEAFHVPQSGAREGSRMKREPYAGLVNCWGGGSDLRNPRPLGDTGSACLRRVQGK